MIGIEFTTPEDGRMHNVPDLSGKSFGSAVPDLSIYWKKDGTSGPATGDWSMGNYDFTLDASPSDTHSIYLKHDGAISSYLSTNGDAYFASGAFFVNTYNGSINLAGTLNTSEDIYVITQGSPRHIYLGDTGGNITDIDTAGNISTVNIIGDKVATNYLFATQDYYGSGSGAITIGDFTTLQQVNWSIVEDGSFITNGNFTSSNTSYLDGLSSLVITSQFYNIDVNGSGTTAAVGGVLFTQTSDQTVTNTTTETTIIGSGIGQTSLPANFFDVGKKIRLKVAGVYSTPALSTPSLIIKVKYGSTILAQVTTTGLIASASGLRFDGEIFITCRSTGGSGSVVIDGGVTYATGVVGTTSTDTLNNGGAAKTINTTTANSIDVTIQWDTATSTRIAKSTTGVLELLNSA